MTKQNDEQSKYTSIEINYEDINIIMSSIDSIPSLLAISSNGDFDDIGWYQLAEMVSINLRINESNYYKRAECYI